MSGTRDLNRGLERDGARVRNLVLAGVGGHGVLALSRVIAEGALAAGFDVRKSEIHGMSQRGGSVLSEVRYGSSVNSPLIPDGSADLLISLELLEALRHLHRLKTDGILLVNEQRITPAPAGSGPVLYPEDVLDRILDPFPEARILPAHDMATELGESRAANMVMLGAFAACTEDIPIHGWEEVIESAFRSDLVPVNLAAFRAGLSLASAW
ncbi:MAG: indolepyruvate oxidoreductase subunit beta [marine benthic group bacterium]|nr:indolepyruvate oxidoreductase subunit beta [Gemmatimonadota bacterium]